MISFEGITNSVDTSLRFTFSPIIVTVIESVIIAVLVIAMFAILGICLVYMERKVCAFMQIRLGPNRVGPKGTLQVLADTVKLIMKENITPDMSDKIVFNLAPYVAMTVTALLFLPLPWALNFQIWDINIGVLYFSAVSTLTLFSILMGGWSSNSKFPALGAMRAGAQMVSFELSEGLCILCIVLLTGSMRFSDIVNAQQTGWWIFRGHIPAIIAFLIFIITATAESNRSPFDFSEAESELSAGYHTEYTGMKFGLFYLAEYINLFLICMFGAVIFLGGPMPLHIGHFEAFNHIMDYVPSSIWMLFKTVVLVWVIMWIRWTLPRTRIETMLRVEWKYLLPISMLNLLLTAVVVYLKWYF